MTRLTSSACIALLTTVLAAACAEKTPAPSASSTAPPTASPSQPAATPVTSSAEPKASDLVSSDILDEIALTRTGIQARRQAIVTSAMDLTAQESAAFWPVYRDYRNDMAKVDDRLVELIILYATNYDSLTDELAKKLLVDYLDIERGRLDVKSQYLPRFESVLPARKVTRFFQIDNKLDKKLQAELAADIPLTR
jgi:hypothetical protein